MNIVRLWIQLTDNDVLESVLMEDNVHRRPLPPCWLFGECFDESSDCHGMVSKKSTEQTEPLSRCQSVIAAEEQLEMHIDATVSESLLEDIECDTASSSRTHDSDAACEITLRPNTHVEGSEEQALGDSYTSCELLNQPASSTTPLEKQQYLQNIVDNVSGHFPELAFILAFDGRDKSVPILKIFQKSLFSHPPHGMTSRVQITVQYKSYSIYVLMRLWKEGQLESIDDVFELCSILGNKSKHKFCPGIDFDYYEREYYQAIRFHIKSVRQSSYPFSRVDSVNCKLLFVPAANVTVVEKEASEVKCSACKGLIHYLNLQKRRTLAESPGRKIKRQQPSSRARLQYMSPASQQKRKQLAQYERSSSIRKLNRFEESEVVLNDEQNEEMSVVMDAVQDEELEKLFQEGDQHGVGSLMKTIWFTDKERQKKDFSQDQAKNELSNGRGNRWSMITIRMALAVYTRSPAAYKALQSFGILKLPSKSTMQAYTGAFLHSPGANNVCIIDQVARYIAFKEECRTNGKQEPQADGVIIFDEVKVACQLMWNSRNHQLMGLAMTQKDLSSLNDIYKILQDPTVHQTSYILQFLWRDLTSNYDIVGPYFTCSASMEGKFVLACIFETIKLFQYHNLKTSLLVCDGGSANAAVIKASHGCHGAYSVKDTSTQEDKFKVEPWIINPFNPPNKIFWLICPSHQLKNMINALFSSKVGGTKQFKQVNGVEFGWKTITDLYKRELIRVSKNQARMVPRLREAYCLRDSWTKLNVLPAKIMQQEQVLGELYWYVNQTPPPNDAPEVSETLAYLKACNLLFEQGFLSHDCIRSMDCDTMKNINKGFEYFSGWLNSILDKDPKYPHTASTQKSFLSWQTWDLLRIDVYGFKAFCQWFLKTYPTYFVSPLRLSGSAVESLFSQYKFTAGGKLDAVNYTTARAAHLVKQCAASHHSGTGYRDEKLNFIETPLQRKSYQHHKR